MWSERKHGLSTEEFPVSAFVESSKNLKDLKRQAPYPGRRAPRPPRTRPPPRARLPPRAARPRPRARDTLPRPRARACGGTREGGVRRQGTRAGGGRGAHHGGDRRQHMVSERCLMMVRRWGLLGRRVQSSGWSLCGALCLAGCGGTVCPQRVPQRGGDSRCAGCGVCSRAASEYRGTAVTRN